MHKQSFLFDAIKDRLPVALHEIQALQKPVNIEFRINADQFPVIQTTQWKIKKFYKPISKIQKGNDL